MSWLHANAEGGAYPATWYAEGLTFPDPCPPLTDEVEADLCVIGGGLTGLSAALHGARAGMRVVLLEARRIGWGASGRNGGQVGTGLNWSQRKLTATFGEAAARAVWALTEEAKALTRALIAAHAPEAGYRPGIVRAARTSREAAHDAAEARWMAEHYGTASRILDPGATATALGTDAFAGGVLDPTAGFCNPLALTLGLARACAEAGVIVHEGTEAHDLGPVTRTASGTVAAPYVLHATNGYATHLTRSKAARVLPINNFVAVTEPLGDRTPMPEPLAVADSRTVVNYWWQSGDGRLIYGGGESYGRRFPPDIEARVRANLARTYPGLADVAFTHAWGGTLAVTPTRLPYLAETAPGHYAAGGYSGHGLALSALCGALVVEAIAGDRSRFDALARLPTPALPGGRWVGGAVTNAAMMWGAMRDRLTDR